MTTTYELYTNENGTPKAVEGKAPAIIERVEALEEKSDDYLPLSGGTMTGDITFPCGGGIHIDSDYPDELTLRSEMASVNGNDLGAYLALRTSTATTNPSGSFALGARTVGEPNGSTLYGGADGTLTWHNKSVERVNSQEWNYIRYENGLQICRFWVTIPSGSIGTNITYPMPFISNPAVSVAYIGGNVGEEVCHVATCIGTEKTTGCAVFARNIVDQSYHWGRNVWVIAIGQWK